MEASGHTSASLRLVVDVVNALTPGHARGRPVAVPSRDDLRATVVETLAARPNRARDWEAAGPDQLEALLALATRWRAVLDAAPAGVGVVAPLVNDLLVAAPVAPALVHHDGEPWHLHAHAADAGPADGLAATAALALASVVADDALDRLGTCEADACDRTYLDTSRNGSRRYCSASCQARAKSAAYRARQG